MTLELDKDGIDALAAAIADRVAEAAAEKVVARLSENKDGKCMGPQAAKLLGVSLSRLRQLAKLYPEIKETKRYGKYYDVKNIMKLREIRERKGAAA